MSVDQLLADELARHEQHATQSGDTVRVQALHEFKATLAPAAPEAHKADPPITPAIVAVPKPTEPFSYVQVKHYDASTPRPFIIKGLASAGRVIEFLGKPGNSKTALLIHTAKCVARGTPWFAKTTKRYAVVFVAAEGRQDVLDRFAGYDRIHGVDPNEAPVFVLPRVNFSLNDERNRLVATIEAIEREHGATVGALMVDTLAASTSGDENDTAVMRDAAQRIRSVAEHFNLAAFVTHHPTKSNEETSRGAGAWLGAIDQQIFVKKNGGSFELSGGKQRQSGLGRAKLAYDLESAAAGTWEDGDAIGVPVVREHGMADATDFPANAEQDATEARLASAPTIEGGPFGRVHVDLLQALETAQAAAGGAGVSERAWRKAYRDQQEITTDGAGATFRRYRKGLVEAGHVIEAGGFFKVKP